MPVKIDCGDLCTITFNLQVGIGCSPNSPMTDEEKEIAVAAIQKFKEEYEGDLAEEMAHQAGFPEKRRKELIAEREKRNRELCEAEERGRKEKYSRSR